MRILLVLHVSSFFEPIWQAVEKQPAGATRDWAVKILLVHNHYQQPGGEDQVFAAEAQLLASRGHEVSFYTAHNNQVSQLGRGALVASTIWSRAHYQGMCTMFRRVRPDVVHVHNTMPLISPAVYYAARACGAAVVQTLHNYRLVCPSAVLFRDGAPCEACVGRKVAWPAMAHSCYRNSFSASTVVAVSLAIHRAKGTYREKVDRYIALTRFAKRKLVEGGLPSDRMGIKPNFLAQDPGPGAGSGGYVLFAGRLVPEKGIQVVLEAWKRLEQRIPLRIAGDGPLKKHVVESVSGSNAISVLGAISREEVQKEMKEAVLVIVPSVWYEGFPMTIVESFAAGTPVVASRLGSMAEIVDDGRTGYLFNAGDATALAANVETLFNDGYLQCEMRRACRAEYEALYTRDVNYDLLIREYARALEQRRQ